MSEKTILVWFRNDLRIRDNEILLEATRKADKIVPVYCFDPFYFKENESGNSKTGNIRARFLIESVTNLRENLRRTGGELIIRFGNPAEVIPVLAAQYQVSEVYHHREVAHEETEISEQVEAALWKIKLNLKHFIGHTLYHKEDLPFPIKDIPDSFAVFKKKIERDSSVRQCSFTPQNVNIPEITEPGEMPSLQLLGLQEPYDDPRATEHFLGGEDAGLEQMKKFFAANCNACTNKKNAGSVNLSKLSPWIALGCISLREVYWEIIRNQQLNNVQYQGMLLDLLWRDYFRFMFKKHGQKFISKNAGINAEATPDQDVVFENWKNGETGSVLVDAIMHELNATGYINNTHRQLVAIFLVNELKVDWKKGAAYFEEKLIDYSPASNWGNWAFIAGVNDSKESRYNLTPIPDQIGKSDYIDTWIAPLKDAVIPAAAILK